MKDFEPGELVTRFKSMAGDLANQLRGLPDFLGLMLTQSHPDGTPYWQRITITEHGGKPRVFEHETVEEWITSRSRAGLNMTVERLMALVEQSGDYLPEESVKEAERLVAKCVGLKGHGGTRKPDQVDNVNLKGGNGKSYLLRRMAREDKKKKTNFLDRYEAGEFPSVRQAAIAAGIVKEKTPLEKIQALLPKLTPEERAELHEATAV